jgi:prolyl-tRNA synthetase
VPMLRDKPEDSAIIAFCNKLQADLSAQTCFGMPIRALVDEKPIKSADKRWSWIRRGAPIICEIGLRDASSSIVTFMRRDKLRAGDKIASLALPIGEFVGAAPSLLKEIQLTLFEEAKAQLAANIFADIDTFEALEAYFGAAEDDEEKGGKAKGWVRCAWSKPTGAALEKIADRLQKLKLTIRNVPMNQPTNFRPCIFTGAPGVEEILVARAY